MAAVCSHKDESRRQVSATAHAVAYFRSLEDCEGNEALFTDPYASLMSGEVGKLYVERKLKEIEEPQKGVSSQGRIDGIAVRTKAIDDEVIKGFSRDSFLQICVLGAGLDTRAWRLSNDSKNDIKYFEVDFPELFEYKLPLLATAEAVSQFNYHNVVADLSLPVWPEVLIAAGFDVTQPTLWLLEGFIGYLTEEEADSLFEKISRSLSAKGSRMVATFLTPDTQTSTGMHRFFPENPLLWCNGHGWSGVQTDIHLIGEQLGRPLLPDHMIGYYIVVADLL
jgi:methyltransferase (TIGR00027 family)